MGVLAALVIALIAGNLLVQGLAVSAGAPQPPADPPTLPKRDPLFDYVPGQILVAFEPTDTLAQRQQTLQGRGLTVMRDIAPLGVSVVSVPAGRELATIKELSQLPGVLYAEPNYLLYALGTPNDPSFGVQWGPTKINAPAAWDVTTGSISTTIAIVDTGIDLAHPDLQAKIVAGYDFVNGDTTAQDDNGHGTHCAGIAAAIGNNGVGVAGVSWQARLMPVKVLDASGRGTTDGVAAGITWAVDHGATVISMSLGGGGTSMTLDSAVGYAYAHGVVVVAAAGNDASIDVPTYPAAIAHVIGVGATTSSDVRAYYSNQGSYVDVAAPGSYIYSTYWSASAGHTYAYLSGTSMATPHVAGLAALVKALDPALTPDEVEATIEATAVDLGTSGRDGAYGAGRIDALAAVNALVMAQPPDLVVDRILASPAQPLPGQPVTLTVTVRNGGSLAPGPTRLDLYVERTPAGCGDLGDLSQDVPALAAGESRDFAFAHAGFAAVGSHAVTAWVDADCTLAESDDANNGLTVQVLVALYQQRLDAGSTTSYTDAAGGVWAKDRVYRVGGFGRLGGTARGVGNVAIAGTQDDPLYQTERYWPATANPGYRFTVPNGTYRVELRFAETFWGAANKRKFSVKMEGKALSSLTKFDIFAAAGAKNKAVAKAVTVTVADGILDIAFIKLTGYDVPKVDAIYVRQTAVAGAAGVQSMLEDAEPSAP